ncbi:MAG: asparagine synthase-related protein [Nanoarchaeota archaeon]|nr:asparagine synthase-related protein [Nanoarchaeota archaeon]
MVFGMFNKQGIERLQPILSEHSLLFEDSCIRIYSENKTERIIEDRNKIIIINAQSDNLNFDDADFIKEIEGSFYLLTYDKTKKELKLGIDRLGIGDLFYSESEGNVSFATSIKDIFDLGVDKVINTTSLRYYLVYQFIPRPLTIFKNVLKVPAAHIVGVNDKITIEKYWDMDFNPVKENDEEYHAHNVKTLLKSSIKKQLEKIKKRQLEKIKDGKIGLLLSGGLDSSIIAFVLKELGADLYTFTGVYPYDATYGGNKFGRKIAEEIGSNHTEIVIGPDAIKRLPELYDKMYEPLADSSLLQAHIIMDAAKKFTPNLFAGEFSDILFGGMQIYVQDKIAREFWNEAPIKEKIMVRNNGGSSCVDNFINLTESFQEFKHYKYGEIFFADDSVTEIFNEQTIHSFGDVQLNRPIAEIYDNLDLKTEFDKQLYTDLKLASQRRIFHLTEPGKINDINLVLPYINNNLIDYSGKIPGDLKIKGLNQKYILKKAFETSIPQEIIQRKKEGFTAPFNLWFKHNKSWVLNQFEQNKLWSQNAKSFVCKIIDKENASYEDNMKVWILLNLSIWHQKVFS